jgi:hypothetical protein
VSAAFATCGADDVNTHLKSLGYMPGCTGHVHHYDAMAVELVDYPLGRDADSAHKKRHFLLDNHVYKLIECTTSIIMICLASITADLREEQIESERHRASDRIAWL